MRTGPKLKGRQIEAPGGSRSGNHRDMSNVLQPKQRSKAEAPTQGRTRNQPNTTSGSGIRSNVGVGVADTYHANSRSPVDKKFDRHPHD